MMGPGGRGGAQGGTDDHTLRVVLLGEKGAWTRDSKSHGKTQESRGSFDSILLVH